ncbi:hypothetical protein MML48_3g00017571 [Holotrichia oblita]|uniref:Uncharacterized protein n=1 Tax=Holotrichia oblita TaxID=644536 RepID=A0ACB9TEI0_HOLOL|nr:hypothetical protein MML48_3g00017571 [Holotrichia oblita]
MFGCLQSSYLSSLGGRDTTALTNNILKRCLTNQLACNYSFRGKGAKKAFANLHLNRVVISAVKSKNPQCLERDIEDHIKVWLKHSPQRYNIDCAKRRK